MRHDALTQIHASGIFVDDNILDVSASGATADILCLKENGTSGHDGLFIVDGDDGVTQGCTTLLLDKGSELIARNWRCLC